DLPARRLDPRAGGPAPGGQRLDPQGRGLRRGGGLRQGSARSTAPDPHAADLRLRRSPPPERSRLHHDGRRGRSVAVRLAGYPAGMPRPGIGARGRGFLAGALTLALLTATASAAEEAVQTPVLSWETGSGRSYLIPALEVGGFIFGLNQFNRHFVDHHRD